VQRVVDVRAFTLEAGAQQTLRGDASEVLV